METILNEEVVDETIAEESNTDSTLPEGASIELSDDGIIDPMTLTKDEVIMLDQDPEIDTPEVEDVVVSDEERDELNRQRYEEEKLQNDAITTDRASRCV